LIYLKLLICITIIVSFLVVADILPSSFPGIARAGPLWEDFLSDPLDPKFVGESMDMPLDQELIQKARKAGIIKDSNPLYKPDSQQPGFKVLPRSEEAADNSLDKVNVTGKWSFNLKGEIPNQINLYLIQTKNLVVGQGVINKGNGTQNATASGSISGKKMSLSVMPVGIFNLYKLNLSLSSLTAGTYTVYMSDGHSWSGDVKFAVSSNIFKSGLPVSEYW
jgi:hypothetical protein